MNWYWTIAGGLSLGLALIHILGGEYVLRKMPTTVFPVVPNGGQDVCKQEVRASWHMLSAALLISGSLLLLMGLGDSISDPDLAATIIAAHFVGYGLMIGVIPVVAMKRLKALIESPQWVIIFAMAAIVWVGTL